MLTPETVPPEVVAAVVMTSSPHCAAEPPYTACCCNVHAGTPEGTATTICESLQLLTVAATPPEMPWPWVGGARAGAGPSGGWGGGGDHQSPAVGGSPPVPRLLLQRPRRSP